MSNINSYNGSVSSSGDNSTKVTFGSLGNFDYNPNLNTSSTVSTGRIGGSFSNIANQIRQYNTDDITDIKEIEESVDLNEFIEEPETKQVPQEENKPWWQKGLDWLSQAGATIAVGTTSIVSGVLDVGESLLDGGAYLVSGTLSLVGLDDAATNVKEFIATDLVGEANKAFYDNTEIGRAINDASSLKYDSEAAQGIRDVSEKITVFAAATAATVLTGGAAAPLVSGLTVAGLGFTSGVGNQAENVYQKGTDTTWQQEAGILVSGIGEAANWYAQGRLGAGGLEFLKTASNVGFKQTGAALWNGIKTTAGNVKSYGLRNTITGSLKNSNLTSMLAADNLAESAGIIGDNVSDWLLGNEEFNLKNAASAGGELIAAWALNMFFDGAGNYLSNANKAKVPKTMLEEITDIDNQLKNTLDSLNPNSPNYMERRLLAEQRAELKKELLELIHSKGITMENYVKYCGTIAQVDPNTQILITEASSVVHKKAILAEPTVSAMMKSLETDGVTLEGFSHRFKSVDSIGRKVTNLLKGSTDQMEITMYAAKVNDNLRYTLLLDETKYTDQMYTRLHKLLDEGYEIIGMNNSWGNKAYQGLNVSMLAPEGVRVEVQFHTPESFYAKETLSHSYYEIKRSALADTAERDIAGQIQILDQAITVNTIEDLVGIPWRDIAERAKVYN